MNVLEMITRVALVFLLLIVWARVLGRKLISQMTFFDFVAGVTMGSIGASIIFSPNIRLVIGLVGLSLFCALVLLTSWVSLKSMKADQAINAGPLILVNQGKVLVRELAKIRMTYSQLLMLLRKKNAFYLDEVEQAVFETDGTLSVQMKTSAMQVTRQDLSLTVSSRGMPHVFISDGKLIDTSLKALNKDRQWVDELMKQQGLNRVSDVALAQMDQTGHFYIVKKKTTCE
ncbi:DUF421 domain-containing protein [Paenibacillus vandeheii]